MQKIMFQKKPVTFHFSDGAKKEVVLELRFAANRRLDWAMRKIAAEKTQSPDRFIYSDPNFQPSNLDF
jgi:hypothetical protein